MFVGADDLAPWFRGRKKLIVAKGKKHSEHTVRGLAAADRAKLVIGPTGRLRAPTLLVGDAVVVGFNDDVYRELFR